MCLVDFEKAFNRVPGKVMEWTMRNKGLPEVIVKAVMSLYLGEKMKVGVHQKYVHQESPNSKEKFLK